MTRPQTSSDRMAASIARIEQRRGVAIDIVGIALAVGGTACLTTVLVMQLGVAMTALLLGAGLQVTLGVAIMRRANAVPEWAQVRPVDDEPDAVDDAEDDPGMPYAPARTVEDGAPPSPMSGR